MPPKVCDSQIQTDKQMMADQPDNYGGRQTTEEGRNVAIPSDSDTKKKEHDTLQLKR